MDIKALMRQAQQVQEKMKKVEEELANKEYEGASGGGLVKVIINGSGSLLERPMSFFDEVFPKLNVEVKTNKV